MKTENMSQRNEQYKYASTREKLPIHPWILGRWNGTDVKNQDFSELVPAWEWMQLCVKRRYILT